MSGKSQQALRAALDEHERRYNHDLAYLMKRLDKMDQIIHEQGMLISRLGLRLLNLEDERVEKPRETDEWPVEEIGDCRIIQFSSRK